MLTDPSPDAKSRSQGSTAAGIIESAAPYDMNESFPGLSYARGDDSRLGVGTGPATPGLGPRYHLTSSLQCISAAAFQLQVPCYGDSESGSGWAECCRIRSINHRDDYGSILNGDRLRGY